MVKLFRIVYVLPIANYQLPITNYQLLITNYSIVPVEGAKCRFYESSASRG